MEKPLVSISCLTYNHAKYIRDALEGFLMQKTNFPFEVLIHDDASTDGTADIIREYEAKYPDIIKPIYQTENQYSKGVMVAATFNHPRAQGKYIAVCEGDDFWCDPDKLQIQYDFMETHPDYSMVACGGYILNDFQKVLFPVYFPSQEFPTDNELAMKKIILNDHPFNTPSILFSIEKYKLVKKNIVRDTLGAPMGDLQFFFYLASVGKIKYLRKRMFTYRIHANSVSNYSKNQISSSFVDRCLETKIKMAQHNNMENLIPLFSANIHSLRRNRLTSFIRLLLTYVRGYKSAYKKFNRLPLPERILISDNYHFFNFIIKK